MSAKKDVTYRNLNVLSNAIEIAVCAIQRCNNEHMRKTMAGDNATREAVSNAVASRMQRHLNRVR